MNGHKTIRLVEDNESDIALAKRALRKGQILNEIIVAEDGQAALDYLFGEGAHAGRDTALRPAVVLLDLILPKISGDEVLRRLREREITRLLPVVVFSTSNDERDIRRCYDLGANSYIRKPVDFMQFSEAVTQLARYWLVINEPAPVSGAPVRLP